MVKIWRRDTRIRRLSWKHGRTGEKRTYSKNDGITCKKMGRVKLQVKMMTEEKEGKGKHLNIVEGI